jgi:hypothetical protein
VIQGTTQEIAEAAQLKTAVANISAMLASGTACQGSASSILLATMLESAKSRLAHIERNIEEEEKEQRQKSASELAIAYKARQETKLNAVEQRQYAEFLEKPHFTKSDFGILESFYTKTWDRLSEDGKAEMSQRVWGGVRSKEYEFSELPDIVKDKEAQRLYDQLKSKAYDENLSTIPKQEREDFMKAWSDGKRDAAQKVLERASFAENVALSAGSVRSESAKIIPKAAAAQTIELAASEAKEAKIEPSNQAGRANLKLEDLLLAEPGDSKSSPPST